MNAPVSIPAVRAHVEALAKEARIDALWRERLAALNALSPDRQAMLDEAMAKIADAFPPRKGPAEIFSRLAAAGHDVLFIDGDV